MTTENEERKKFEKWMKQVNKIVIGISGVSVFELQDCLFYDWFEAGISAKEAALQALDEAGFPDIDLIEED